VLAIAAQRNARISLERIVNSSPGFAASSYEFTAETQSAHCCCQVVGQAFLLASTPRGKRERLPYKARALQVAYPTLGK
jgi:hypothetical protein